MSIQTTLHLQKNDKSKATKVHSDWVLMNCYAEDGALNLNFADRHSNDRIQFKIHDENDIKLLLKGCEKSLTKTVNQNV